MAKPLPKKWRDQYRDDPYLSDPEFLTGDEYPEPITSEIPKHLKRGGVGRMQRPKECHHRAYLYALHHREEPGLQLVYGTYGMLFVNGTSLSSGEHSWIELPGNITFDGNRMEFYRTDEYRQALHAAPRWMYTGMEAIRLSSATGHTGPWTEAECIDVLGAVPGITALNEIATGKGGTDAE